MQIAKCTEYKVQCTKYIVQCTVLQCTQRTGYRVKIIEYIVHYSSEHREQGTEYSVYSTVQCTVQYSVVLQCMCREQGKE